MKASYLDLVSFFSVHPEAMRYATDSDCGYAFSSMLRALFLIFATVIVYRLGSSLQMNPRAGSQTIQEHGGEDEEQSSQHG